MRVALVFAGLISAFYGGCWLAARRAPILCDDCQLFIACDEWEAHSPRCRAQHEPAAGVPSAPAAAFFPPTEEQRGTVRRLNERIDPLTEPLTNEEWARFAGALGINPDGSEDDASRRTALNEGDE